MRGAGKIFIIRKAKGQGIVAMIGRHSYWDDQDRFRGAEHPVVRTFAMQRVHLLLRNLNSGEIGRALDVGCGNGISTHYFPEITSISAVGIDSSLRMLLENPCPCLICGDAAILPFRDNTFDLVYSWELLHHVMDPLGVIEEMKRVSRRYVTIIEPNGRNLGQQIFAVFSKSHRQVLKYSRPFLITLARRSGMRVIDSATIGWIFPHKTPMWILPILEKLPLDTRFGISNMVICEKRSQYL